MDSKKLPLVLAGLMLLGAACDDDSTPDPCSVPGLEATMNGALQRAQSRNPENPGWLLTVREPSLGLDFHGAIGADPVSGRELAPEATFRIASVTKTFTAAATLRLVEAGRLGLDEPIANLLPAPYPALLAADGYEPTAITLRHLLTHTSGLFDYGTSADYQAAVRADPGHRWTREEQVRFAMQHGSPVGGPGEVYAYSDTGYILLGAILEEETGLELAAALRSLDRFDALGLSATWLETLEPPPPGAPERAPQTIGGTPATQVDASFDLWGGGGLVSNTRDLETFYRALFEGRVFSKTGTLETMLTIPETNLQDQAAMGIFRGSLDGTLCWLHGGFWGDIVGFCPELGVGIAVAGLEQEKIGTGFEDLLIPAIQAVRACKQ